LRLLKGTFNNTKRNVKERSKAILNSTSKRKQIIIIIMVLFYLSIQYYAVFKGSKQMNISRALRIHSRVFFVFFMPLIDVLKFIPAHQNHQRIIESQWRWLLIQFLLFLLRWIKLWDNIPVYINKTNTYLYLKIISQNFYIKLLKETNCKI